MYIYMCVCMYVCMYVWLQSLSSVFTGRVFLWHKDTDPYSRDERIQVNTYMHTYIHNIHTCIHTYTYNKNCKCIHTFRVPAILKS